VHVAASYALLAFAIVHVYLTTTGHTPSSNIKAMITGWEAIESEDEPGTKTTESATLQPGPAGAADEP